MGIEKDASASFSFNSKHFSASASEAFCSAPAVQLYEKSIHFFTKNRHVQIADFRTAAGFVKATSYCTKFLA